MTYDSESYFIIVLIWTKFTLSKSDYNVEQMRKTNNKPGGILIKLFKIKIVYSVFWYYIYKFRIWKSLLFKQDLDAA